MADVTLTVDGKKVTAPAGTLLIKACKTVGIEVPSFCYYPNLSLQGACRMCLVKIEKMPKLQTACTTLISEGMTVTSDSEEIKQARKSMLELLLGNHPLDCPVCDAGGECELQDMTFSYGAAESKFMEAKNHKEEQQWSPVVFFDRPRCILCYRCVRVCGEGMDVWALGVQNRGVGSIIAPNQEDHLDCEECGMCIDICPVGALTSDAYSYKTRPWEMHHVGTICAHGGDGGKTTVAVRIGKPGSTAAMREVLSAPAILLIGNDPTNQHPLLAWQIRTNVRLRRARLYVINSAPIKLRRQSAGFALVPVGAEAKAVAYLAGDDSPLD